MDIKNCKRCGKVFGYTGNLLCPECVQKEEEEFILVKDYIYDHPKCSAYEVSEVTGVSVRSIISFLKQDRLESVEGLSGLLICEKCGVPVKSGRYCPKCIAELKKETKRLLNTSGENVARAEEMGNAGKNARIYVNEGKYNNNNNNNNTK
ncbi:MAG TPA: MerR family transcriptional regulator [Clostridiales bacterium]|nr:MAG: hypothetical protein A2Y22_01920 [Clostridiales bacterium GWD2_32_59]HAN09301.1 MerR family transcriptional regulator [Clostridiales bacterium]